MKINMVDWIPQIQNQDKFKKCECDIESLPPPIPPKIIEIPLIHQNASHGPSAIVLEESGLKCTPALPPKPAPRPSGN